MKLICLSIALLKFKNNECRLNFFYSEILNICVKLYINILKIVNTVNDLTIQ